jgi:hypothetical protein
MDISTWKNEMKVRFLIFVLFFSLTSIAACKDKSKIEALTIVQEWVGKTIKFPNIVSVNLYSTDKDTNQTIDSDDKNDELNNKLNHFPNNPTFQCFLLDKNNKVLAIGNPANNTKIWELYKKIITGEVSDESPVTTIEPVQTAIELNDLETGKTSEVIFVLKNTGTNPLVIQRVESSCGCTIPYWEKQPITAGNSTEIKVKITPEKSEYFNKTVTVHCNTEEGQISFIVKGTVK